MLNNNLANKHDLKKRMKRRKQETQCHKRILLVLLNKRLVRNDHFWPIPGMFLEGKVRSQKETKRHSCMCSFSFFYVPTLWASLDDSFSIHFSPFGTMCENFWGLYVQWVSTYNTPSFVLLVADTLGFVL